MWRGSKYSFLVCLSDKWSPALQIRTVLLSIQALLSAPNPDDPLANDVAEQWKKNESNAIETGERRTWNTAKLLCVSAKVVTNFPGFKYRKLAFVYIYT